MPSLVPELSPLVSDLKARAAAFIEAELHPLEARIEEAGTFDLDEYREVKARARAAGFSNLNMSKEMGGLDLPMVELVAMEEEAGKATNGLGFLVADRGPRELAELATPSQIERYVMPVVRGETREAWAITEPGAGSDVGAIATTARREGEQWVLNGEKWFVTGAQDAGYFIVLAWAEGAQTLFLVDKDTPGAAIKRYPRFMHDPYISLHAEMTFSDCRVPEANRVPGGGQDGARLWFTVERLMIAARCCGSAERLIEVSSEFAKQRVAFGSPISEYQGVQFPLADSLTELAAARLLTYNAAQEFDERRDLKVLHGKSAMAKLFASEMVGRVADRAVQIFGGRGFMTENVANRYYREVRVDRIWEGTSEIQRLIIARGLLKRGAKPYVG